MLLTAWMEDGGKNRKHLTENEAHELLMTNMQNCLEGKGRNPKAKAQKTTFFKMRLLVFEMLLLILWGSSFYVFCGARLTATNTLQQRTEVLKALHSAGVDTSSLEPFVSDEDSDEPFLNEVKRVLENQIANSEEIKYDPETHQYYLRRPDGLYFCIILAVSGKSKEFPGFDYFAAFYEAVQVVFPEGVARTRAGSEAFQQLKTDYSKDREELYPPGGELPSNQKACRLNNAFFSIAQENVGEQVTRWPEVFVGYPRHFLPPE